ncbi:MAG TPA: alpha/beta hydrolase [Alphaproteobacteria bacterium]|nr:alpha/beta hydrolase [Alphaproteobacteria bacterium]
MELTVDGRKVFAAGGGKAFKPELPTVIFIHGAGMDHTVWTLQTRFFAHHGRNVLALDLPGHGRSDGPALTSIGALADWVIRAMDALKLDKAAFVGHSMGALIALETAARAPTRVWALALLGVAPRMPVHPDLLKAAQAGAHEAIDLLTSWGYGRRAHLGGAQAPGAWMLGAGARLMERASDRVLGTDLAACNAYLDAAEAAGKVTCPALVIAGEIDRMTAPAGARELAARFQDGRLIAIPNAGHLMMIEQPDRTLDALAEAV